MDSRNTHTEKLVSKDQSFKIAVHNSDILSWFIRCNVDEFKEMSIEQIKSCLDIGSDGHTVIAKENELFSEEGKIVADSIFDVKVPGTDDRIKVIVNLEAQNDPHPPYPLEKRAEYYMARLVSSQKGSKFTNDNYKDLCKVYSIWLILDPDIRDRNTAVRYGMKAENIYGVENRKLPVLDTFNIIFINVGDYNSYLPDVSAFPAALFSKTGMEKRSNLMEERFNIKLDDSLNKEVENVASLAEDIYNKIHREGEVDSSIKTMVLLVREEGFSIEKAASFVDIPEDYRDYVFDEVKKRLNSI